MQRMRRFSETFYAVLDRLEITLAYASGIAIVLLAGMITFDLVARRVSFIPFRAAWSNEVSEYLMVYLTLLAAPWVLRVGGHVTLDLLTGRLSPTGQRRLQRMSDLISALACALMMGFAYRVVLDAFRRGIMLYNILVVPRWLVIAPIVAGFALLAVEFLRRLTGEPAGR